MDKKQIDEQFAAAVAEYQRLAAEIVADAKALDEKRARWLEVHGRACDLWYQTHNTIPTFSSVNIPCPVLGCSLPRGHDGPHDVIPTFA